MGSAIPSRLRVSTMGSWSRKASATASPPLTSPPELFRRSRMTPSTPLSVSSCRASCTCFGTPSLNCVMRRWPSVCVSLRRRRVRTGRRSTLRRSRVSSSASPFGGCTVSKTCVPTSPRKRAAVVSSPSREVDSPFTANSVAPLTTPASAAGDPSSAAITTTESSSL